MHGVCIPHRIPRAWEQQGEARRRSRHKNNSKRVVTNIDGRNEGSMMGKRPKQGLTSAKALNREVRHNIESKIRDKFNE